MFISPNVQAELQRAQSLAQHGRHQEAWSAISPLRTSIKDHGQALRLYALIAQGVGKVDDCIDALKRVIELEGGPADIIGALADTLGEAGRHEEAYRQWSRLVALEPGAVDAHLNRAIKAVDAGKPELAIKAADEALERFPDHARLLATKGLALQRSNRIPEAVETYAIAVQADPNRPRTRLNQGVTLRMACEYDQACVAFAEARRLGAKGVELEAAWGAAELEAGRVEDAIDHYHKALKLEPTHHESRNALTRIGIEFRDGEGAFDHYRETAETIGGAKAWLDYIFALITNKRHAEAGEVGRRALARTGKEPNIAAATYFAEGISGDASKALAEFEALPAAVRDDPVNMIALAQLALRAGQPERAADWAERYQVVDQRDQIGWSILGIAWRLLGDPREDWLCNYDTLVMVTDVPSPEGDLDHKEYAKLVAAVLDPLHLSREAPGDQSLRNGTQTSGNLFSRPQPEIQRFRQAVIDAAALKVAELPDDSEHPFLKRKSKNFDFSGSWSVRLRGGGGHHIPHFHGEGWMSSAYYARLPETMGQEDHGGWIEFGRPPEMFNVDLEPRRIVEPKEGRLVLFPSYMWHGTIPFEDDGGTRLTAAFDYQPI